MPTNISIKKCAVAVVSACLCITAIGASAQTVQEDASSFGLELNNAEDTTLGGCRQTYVATNMSDLALDRTAFQVGIFDIDGVVNRLLLLEFGALVAGKTKILQFDLEGQPCGAISRIVVNDVAACTMSDGRGESALCATRLEASSRTAIQFGQ